MDIEKDKQKKSGDDKNPKKIPNILFGINKEEITAKLIDARMNARIGVYYDTIAHI